MIKLVKKRYFTAYDLQIGNTCNMHCKQCCMSDYINCGIEPDYLAFKTFIESHPEIEEIYIGGGEALLTHEYDTLNLMQTFPEIRWKITTNLCYDLTQVRLAILSLASSVQTSFDPKIRFSSVYELSKWYHNLKYLVKNIRKDIDINVCITTELIKYNPLRLIKFFTMLSKLYGYHQLKYKYTLTTEVGRSIENNYLIPKKEELNKWLLEALTYCDLNDNTYKLITDGYFYRCYFRKDLGTINYEGKLKNCPLKVNSDKDYCALDAECMECENYKYCGGKCVLMDCYFDKDVYMKACSVAYQKEYIKDLKYKEFTQKILGE